MKHSVGPSACRDAGIAEKDRNGILTGSVLVLGGETYKSSLAALAMGRNESRVFVVVG